MAELNKSRPVRVYFERDGEPVSYQVRNSAPMLDLIPRIDVNQQMMYDEIELDEIQSFLNGWIEEHAEVERVSLWYRDNRYSILVFTNAISRQMMAELQGSIGPIRSLFGQSQVVVSVFGPQQNDSSLLAKATVLVSRNESTNQTRAA